jgi:transcriptional regulator GlxA family with amidase domain
MVVRDINFFVSSAHRAERLWQRGDDAGREHAQSLLVSLLWQLWDEPQNEVAPADTLLEELAAQIRSAPEQRWTLDDMARQAHLSRAQFTRRFRAAFRASPAQFVIQTRIDRARQLLLETDMTLDQIARALGYADAYFFARQFKQTTGQNPGALRRRRQSIGSS